MRIHRLVLSNVKGVAARDIVFPDEGVVVVEGENEVGKTTMIEALDLLFDEKDSSRKRHVLAMRPVGMDVPSAVEAEVTSGPYRFTYRKQWFRKPATVLTVESPHRENLTGSAAHDRARAILAETTDLELWGALRLMQATPLTATDVSASSALADALEEAAGRVESAGAEGDSLVSAAEAAYAEFYTPTGRPTGDLRQAEIRVEQAVRDRDEAAEAVREVSDDVDRHVAAVRECARIDGQLAAADSLLQEVRAQWSDAQGVLTNAEQSTARAALARQTFDAMSERVQAREALVTEVAELRRGAAEHEAELGRRQQELVAAQEAFDAAVVEVQAARERQRAARTAASRAESDIALARDLDDLVGVADRLRHVQSSKERRRAARQHLADHGFSGSLPEIEQAAHAVELARAEWRAGSATWSLATESGSLDLEVDGVLTRVDGELSDVLGDTTEIRLPGVARLRLVPAAGAGDRADVVARAERALDELLEDAGVVDVFAARAAAAAHAEAEAGVAAAERDLLAASGGLAPEEWVDRGERLLGHVCELLVRRVADLAEVDPGHSAPAELDVLADLTPSEVEDAAVARLVEWIHQTSAMGEGAGAVASDDEGESATTTTVKTAALTREVNAARERESDAEVEVPRWEAEVAALRSGVESGRVLLARAEVAAESSRAALTDAESRLAVAREKASEEHLAAGLNQAHAELAEASAQEAEAAQEVARRDPDSLRVRKEGAESAAESLRRRYGAARDERLALEARLRHAGEQGRAERLTEAESELARAERAFTSVRRRAGAARRLYETLVRHRNQVRTTYVEPFGRAVSRLGRVVYGSDFDIEVGEDLQIRARVLADERIPYEALSTGAKEQMSILTRLACASLVDPHQGAPVILDDALGYADPERLQRVCSAFSLVGGGTQIILLTCTPGRYAGIPDAHVIRL